MDRGIFVIRRHRAAPRHPAAFRPIPPEPAMIRPSRPLVSSCGVVAAALAFVTGTARAVPTGEPPAPEAPVVSPASAEPLQAAAGFGMPDGFVVELFAAEPDVANPVAFSIDERGRVFVCETFRQNRGVSDNRSHDAACRTADPLDRGRQHDRRPRWAAPAAWSSHAAIPSATASGAQSEVSSDQSAHAP